MLLRAYRAYRAYRAGGLRVDKLNDNIEMDIKEMAPMTSGKNLI